MINVLDLVGKFTWCWNADFFIETEQGNYVWKSPDYGGNNTITKVDVTLEEWLKHLNIEYGRDKGKHVIRDYAGSTPVIV